MSAFNSNPALRMCEYASCISRTTNILLTRFLAEEGVAELTDYMPIEQDATQQNEIIRTVS